MTNKSSNFRLVYDRNIILFLFIMAILMGMLGSLNEIVKGDQSGITNIIKDFVIVFNLYFFPLVSLAFPLSKLIQKLNTRTSWQQHFGRRALIELGIVLMMTLILAPLVSYIIITFIYTEISSFVRLVARITIPIFINITLLLSIIEIVILNRERNKYLVLSEKLEKENISSQYDALKNQVNPHFLFNSLNVLSSLIYVDTEKADSFIKEFSKVFRYVLELNADPIVPLKKEIEFLHSYLFLQRIRFNENLHFEINIPEEVREEFLPPLSLQLLLENAIKHNVISESKPLHISLSYKDESIVMRNRLQPRDEEIYSTGIGLNNLREKYQILMGATPEFARQGDDFIAKLPLIRTVF